MSESQLRASGAGRFWRGRIEDEAHAKKIVELGAGWFTIVPILLGLANVASKSLDATQLVTLVLATSPAIALWATKSPLAGLALMVITFLGWVATVVAAITVWLVGPSDGFGYVMLALAALWGAFVYASFRSWRAARFLRDARRIGQVFS